MPIQSFSHQLQLAQLWAVLSKDRISFNRQLTAQNQLSSFGEAISNLTSEQ